MALYLLYESASGYSLFHAYGLDEIGHNTDAVKDSILDLNHFGEIVKFEAFQPFSSALDALNQCNAISKGIMTEELGNFLRVNIPNVKEGKKVKFSLGVAEPKVGSQILEVLNISCQCNKFVLELLRGIRLHFESIIKDLKPTDLEKAQLVLGHGYSLGKFNANQVGNTRHEEINLFSMRVSGAWCSWNFPPELATIDNYLYAKVAKLVQNKSDVSEDHIPQLADILGDKERAKEAVENVASMGHGRRFRPWSNLPDLALHEIAMKMTSPFMYSAFAGVCRSWRSISKSSKSDFIASQAPLLLTLSETKSAVRFYSLTEDRFYSIEHPLMPAVFRDFKYLGHSYGYLIMVKVSIRKPIPFIINLRTGSRINFPSVNTVWIAGLLTSSPTNSTESCMLILHGRQHIHYCRIGDSAWHEVTYNSWIDSLAIHNSLLYIKFADTITVVDYTNHHPPQQLRVIELPQELDTGISLSLMTDFNKDLLLVSVAELTEGNVRIDCYRLDISAEAAGGTTTGLSKMELEGRRVFEDGEKAFICDGRMKGVNGNIYCVSRITYMVVISVWSPNERRARIKFSGDRNLRIWLHPSSFEEWGFSF